MKPARLELAQLLMASGVMLQALSLDGVETPGSARSPAAESPRWFPFQPVRDEFKPTILDCSRWVEAPTGKHGFVTARGARFVFQDGTPVRFWGAQVDLWGKAETDYAVRRLRRQGINITRQHGMEDLGRDAQSFERLDYLIAKLGQNGIYLILDLHYPLNYRFSADDHIRGLPNGGAAPHAEFFDEGVAEVMHERMARIFTHLNPYTGKRYCDDPTLALVEILNEDSLFWGTIELPFRSELEDKFAGWLRKKYGDDAGLRRAWTAAGKVGLADDEGLGPGQRIGLMRNWDFTEKYFGAHPEHRVRGQDQMRFFYALEDRYWAGCRAVLRRAGIRVPIAATNWQGHGFPTRVHMLGQAKLDYIDRHGYWDHPQGEGIRKWRIATAEFHDLPMIQAVRADQDMLVYLGVENLVTEKAWEQVLGMPMTISEWNTCLPNEYSLEGTGLMAAYGSLQGWDGSLEFGYFSPDWPKALGPGSFDLLGNPPQILQFPAASVMWLRQDVKEADVVAESLYDPVSVFGLNEDRKPVPLAAALVGKVGYRFVESPISRGHMSSDPELDHLLSRPAGTFSSAGSGGEGRGE
ncbi:MAG: beta-galactosidase, partial [Verrucomicrobia bacterium]|nr:beta-galactosidase [Verrucomicrobiota bacterium]